MELDKIYEELDERGSFRDSLSTLDEQGRRKWIFPKKPSGKYYFWRKIVSYFLLVFLLGSPFVKIQGEPLLLLNVFDRKFVILGQVFWPQDFHLFVIGMITMLVFIILFTVIYGRIFCGWMCPQTIFMEMVFRRVEYWIEGDFTAQARLKKAPWTTEKIVKKGAKHFIFLMVSSIIMHAFMSYLIGIDRVWDIIQSPPTQNIAGFTAMIFFTGMFYLVFSRIREQVCTNICPYGRLQGVLLDKNSVVVAYDYKRGESKSKLRKGEDRAEKNLGDCIDCKQCVHVCPTGIDIRNGTQLECVNCTACIDACDDIMDRVGFNRGLIRYASDESIATGTPFRFTSRMFAYTSVLSALIGVFIVLMVIRTDVETSILRTPGVMYQELANNEYSNLYNFKVINKSNKDFPLTFKIVGEKGKIQLVGDELSIEKQAVAQGALFIILNENELDGIKTTLKIGVYSGDRLIETVKTTFLGPSL